MTSGVVAFHNFSPETVFTCLSNKDYEGCWSYILELLEGFSNKKNRKLAYAIHYSANKNDCFKDHFTKFSGLAGELLIALLTDPSINIPDRSFIKLLWHHELIHKLFLFCGLTNTDSLTTNILNSKKELSSSEQKRLLLLLSLNTKIDIIDAINRTSKIYQCLAVCSYLGNKQAYKEVVHKKKIELIEKMGPILSSDIFTGSIECIEDRDDLIAALLGIYFTCSYLHYEKKHDIKKHINKAVVRLMKNRIKHATKNIQNPSKYSIKHAEKRNKPRLLVILEVYGPTHAMKRCYDDWLKEFRNMFDVTLCVPQECVYPELLDTYDVRPYYTSEEFLDIVFNHHADVVIFPSIGMTFWGILGSNLRIAPIQIMFLGHPATTGSECIDIVYGPEEVYDERAFQNDTFVAGRAAYQFGNPLNIEALRKIPVEIYNPSSPRPVRVSIVGSAIKITYPFLKLLREIEQDSGFEIEFIFHLSSAGIDAFLFEDELKKQLKNVTLYGFQPYERFLESIGLTDIVLNPFPFGHTNTIIDTLLMGKPCVSLVGREAASRTEHYVLSLVNLANKFEAYSEEEYKQKFYEVAKSVLAGNANHFDRSAIYDRLIQNQNKNGDQIGASMDLKWIYDHIDEIKNTKRKFLRILD